MKLLTQNPTIIAESLTAKVLQSTTFKKVLFLSVVLGVFMTHAQAQDLAIQSIKIGPKAGVNFSHWGGDDFGTESKTGWHIGGFAQLKFSERYELQSELIYSVTGAKRKATRCTCSSNFTLPYLSLPILATFRATPRLYLNLGPQLSFLLNAKDEDGDEFKEEFKSTDLGVVIGAGYELPIGIQLQLRYIAGISNFNNEEMFDEKTSNQIFQISAAYVLWKKQLKE